MVLVRPRDRVAGTGGVERLGRGTARAVASGRSDGAVRRWRAKMLRQRLTRRLLVPRGRDDARILGVTRGGRTHRRLLRALGQRRVRLRARWSGEVQRVGFRQWLLRRALVAGVDGWVRNRSDGAVEALLAGPVADVERILRASWQDPANARVEAIGVRFTHAPVAAGFRVRADRRVTSAGDGRRRTLGTKQNVYRAPAVKNPFTAFRQTALAKGVIFTHFGASPVNMFALRRGRTVELFTTGMSSRVTTSLRVLVNDKNLTKAWLAAHGLPVARGGVATDVEEGLSWFGNLGGDAVVKPINGHKGRGVAVGVRTEAQFRAAFANAQRYHPRILVEETIRGLDLRVVVIDGVARAAVMRVPASVVGDGKTSVAELVRRKNRERLRNPHLALRPLRLDENALRLLSDQGHGVDSTPPAGHRVFLTYTANLAAGGDSVSVLDRLHPEIAALAEAAARSIGRALYLGVDVLLERLDAPPSQQRCAICEINTNASPNVSLFPAFGEPFDTAAAVVDHALEGSEPDPQPHEASFEVVGPEDAPSFERWLRTRAGEHARVQVDATERGLRVSMVGAAGHVERLAEHLWRWPGLGGACVDGLRRVSAPYLPTSSGIAPAVRPPAAAAGSLEGLMSATAPHPDANHDADVALLQAACERQGVRAEARDEGWYVLVSSNRLGLFSPVQAGLPVARLGRLRFPLLRWLADAGLPVPRHTVFGLDELDAARAYRRWRQVPQRLRWVWEGASWCRAINSDDDLTEVWGGWPEIVASSPDLDERRRLRSEAWEVWHEQMRGLALVEDDALARAWGVWPLRVRALLLEDEVPGRLVSVAVIAGDAMLLGPAAGEVPLGDGVAAWCERTAETAVASLPSLDFAVVDVRVASGPAGEDEAHGVIVDVDCTPRLQALERRCAGAGRAVADRVVRELALSDRSYWFGVAVSSRGDP